MVTTVADTLFNRLIDAFPADQSYSPSDFSQDPMPNPLREYLEQWLVLRADDAVRPQDDWIDADHAEVREAAETYRRALARHLKIPASAWRGELERACRTIVSYLIRPAPTLTDLVFADGREDATIEAIAEQFRLMSAYSYFEDVMGAYFDQKDLERISRERFAALARRIDHQMVRDFEAEEWMKLLEPLLEVVHEIPEFASGMPVDVMKTFLEEKGADHLVKRLESRFQSRDGGFIHSGELRDFFERPLESTTVDAEVGAEKTKAPPAGRDASPRAGHVPLWKQFESGQHPSSRHDAAPKSTGEGKPPPTESAGGQPLWKQFHGSGQPSTGRNSTTRMERPITDPPAREESIQWKESTRPDEPGHSPQGARPEDSSRQKQSSDEPSNGTPTATGVSSDELSDLERAVLGQRGKRNRDLFLKHLFSGSSEAYEDALRKLSVAQSWSEASQIIAREVFLKHQVNIYSDPAVAFTDAAEARFRS